ncbi:MAG: hypothetical protein IT379_41210 [Deltaproteobacteria bacterium]|nr:hypothetical protein [Deltaproteobacteria bacterium]
MTSPDAVAATPSEPGGAGGRPDPASWDGGGPRGSRDLRGDRSGSRGRWLRTALIVAVLGGAAIWLTVAFREASSLSGLTSELRDRGRVAVVGEGALLGLDVEGTTLVKASSVPRLERALAGASMQDTERALSAAGVRALLVDTTHAQPGQSVRARLERYAPEPPLGGVFLSPGAALYEKVDLPALDESARDAIGHVARRIMMGSRPPAFRSFPDEMRRDMGIEVMVLVRERGSALLWRSARRGSLARGVIDAALAARDRWAVRESFLGGPITQRLPSLDLEVYAVLFDGRIGDRSPAFLRKVLRLGFHGVGFERRGDWRYVLPEIAHGQAHGEAIGAIRALLADNGLPTDDVDRPELVLYRYSLVRLATSPRGTGSR